MFIRLHAKRDQRRTAAYLVELAFVIPVFLLFVYGILEYGRFVMTLQVLTNAAREGSRYAAVTTNDASANPTLDVQNYVFGYMAGMDQQLTGTGGAAFDPTVNILVYTADSASGQPVNSSGAIVPWSSVPTDANGNYQPQQVAPYTNAGFNQTIAVTINGTYTPILPSFLLMGTTIPVRAQSIMYSEAN